MKKNILLILFFLTYVLSYAQNNVVESVEASTPGVLTVTFTTADAGGEYAPKHILAVWIQNSAGQFVKSLRVNAGSRIQYLTNWNSNSGGNKLDAVTSATLSSHASRTSTWNGTNAATPRAVVVDGTYTIKMELTDKNSAGNPGTFTFVKGPATYTAPTPANIASFSNISIRWVPSAPTDLATVELEDLYSVYPNPTRSNIFVSGLDIQRIDVYTIEGKRVLETIIPTIDLSSFPKGNYLVRVLTKNGTFIKKISKE